MNIPNYFKFQSSALLFLIEMIMPIVSDKAIKLNEAHSGNLKWWTTNILIPTKVSMSIKLYSR